MSQRITNPPQNASVPRGEDATFTCTGVDWSRLLVTVGWRFTPSGASTEVHLFTGTNLTGIEMVTVSGEQRNVLTFSGVRREADGGSVVCFTASVTSDPAILTVQSKCRLQRCSIPSYTAPIAVPLKTIHFTV